MERFSAQYPRKYQYDKTNLIDSLGHSAFNRRIKTSSNPIKIIVTGGTFDKEYDELTGRLEFKHTHLPEILRLGRSMLDVSIQTLMMIDSLQMKESDREQIKSECIRCETNQIIITHGTDTIGGDSIGDRHREPCKNHHYHRRNDSLPLRKFRRIIQYGMRIGVGANIT